MKLGYDGTYPGVQVVGDVVGGSESRISPRIGVARQTLNKLIKPMGSLEIDLLRTLLGTAERAKGASQEY